MQIHRKSLAKRVRTHGFRTRQRTRKGRRMLAQKRRVGRSCNINRSFT